MPTTRRQFIKRSAGMVTVGLVMPSFWLREARAQGLDPQSNRKFVVIQLFGGNDGLNTVVPYTDSRYYALRPILALRESELTDDAGRSTVISGEFALHPSLGEIKDLYDQGRVAIALGVGYAQPNLSHFLSVDIWHTAEASGLGRTGWLGRYADLALVGRPGLPAASLGGELPKSLHADKVVVPNILNFGLYNFVTDPGYPGDRNNQLSAFSTAAGRNFASETYLGVVNATALQSYSAAQQVQDSVSGYKSSIEYPGNNPLASGLKMVAQLLTTIPEAYLMYVQLSGFDHHSDQIDHPNGQPNRRAGQHAVLLNWFSEAVKLFYDDMTEHGLADQVVMMQWSEFGRRPGENASFGSDHGTTNPMFIIGDPVRGGIYGTQPSLTDSALDPAGNPRFTMDFREVYATILDRWLGADSRAVLGGQYPDVGFLG